MMQNMKRLAGGLAIGATALTGLGTVAASSTHTYFHFSAKYGSKAQCEKNRSGVINKIKYRGHHINSARGCQWYYNHWTYKFISYNAPSVDIAGDKDFDTGRSIVNARENGMYPKFWGTW